MSVAAAVAGGVRSGGLAMLAARSGSPGTACASRLRVDVDGDDAADVSACASLRTVGAALALARWNNFEGALRRADEGALDALSDRGASFDDPWFLVDCALPAGSACDDWDGNLDQGSRLYVYGAADALDEVGEWSWDEASDVIGVGADGVEVAGVTFADCDYDSYGFQLSPDASGGRWEPGIPHDAALRVHGAHDVVVRDCVFSNLGGGGVLVAEASARAVVRDSEFRNLGQSAVFLSGNGTTQPRFATIIDNAMSGVGEVLAAAGGLSGGVNKAVSGGDAAYYARGKNNSFARNVVAFSSSLPTRTLWYGDDDALGYVDFNVYYAYGTDEERFQLFFNNSDLTPAGNWTEWLAAGKNRRSTIDAAPKFRDEAALDLCLEDDSPAFKLGFEAIPAHICAAVS
ncbi:ATPase [Aureococcus anophagefferens]|nr:ATPase [Aureococcus anophagefferens]